MKVWLAILLGAVAACPLLAADKPLRKSHPTKEAVVAIELEMMLEADRKARTAWVRRAQRQRAEAAPDPELQKAADELSKVVAENRERLGEIVKEHGWPRRSKFGDKGILAAGQLIRGMNDQSFQLECLKLMEALPVKEVNGNDVANLADCILVAEGLKQKYGTQLTANEKGQVVVYPIEDANNVDRRRARLGLIPMAEYLEKVREALKPAEGQTEPTPPPNAKPTRSPQSGDA